LTGATITIEAERPVEAEIDGDPIGPRRRMVLRVDPGALVVRGA
jgi:diacylglycerol kinase family enzyme